MLKNIRQVGITAPLRIGSRHCDGCAQFEFNDK